MKRIRKSGLKPDGKILAMERLVGNAQ